ncbi:hypothetical protein Q1695_002000 [Nippostrongylus brasiliensis]|nr:hypothetical protein Q1695_002000 [Nippostrongylus brasiliensis]
MLSNLTSESGSETAADSFEESELDQSNSSIWASETQVVQSTCSGEEDDIDSYTDDNDEAASSSSSGFEIGSPSFVDIPCSSEEDDGQYGTDCSLRGPTKSKKSSDRRNKRTGGPVSPSHSMPSTSLEVSDNNGFRGAFHTSASPKSSDPAGIFKELPSPERPFLRPPSATAKELMEIHKNYRCGPNKEWPVLLPPNMDEDLQNLDNSDSAKRPRYLPLAPPYHLLPNTSFFRKAAIKPPPTYNSDGLPPLKRIINRYLASILIDHMKSEEELRLFIQERTRHSQREQQGKGADVKKVEDGDTEGEKAAREEQQQNPYCGKRKPRVVIQHLLYGGQLIHYIQDGTDPPIVPGFFTNAPLIPSNVRITRELNGSAPMEYQQLRTAQGFQFVPLGQSTADGGSCCEDSSTEIVPTATSPTVRAQVESSPSSPQPSNVEEPMDGSEDGTMPEYSVVTTERYASISITQLALNLKFAERRVSICRSPQ